MFSQVVRNPRHLAPCRSLIRQHPVRPSSTSTESTSNPTDPAPSRNSAGKAKTAKKIGPENKRTAHIRTWEPIQNVADAWSIIRVLERKYGKIITAHFLKDFENPSKYQLLSWVIFEDPEALSRIPKTGFNFSIPSAGINKPAHEIGIEDLEHLAVTPKYEPNYEIPTPEPGTEKVIGVRITPSDCEYNSSQYGHRIYQNSNFRTMEAFVGWGGFSPLKPIAPHDIQEYELFSNKANIDNIRMRAALQTAARYTFMRDPGIVTLGQLKEASGAELAEKKQGRKTKKATTVDLEAEVPGLAFESPETASTTTTIASEPLPMPSSSSPKPSESATIQRPSINQPEPTTSFTPEQLEVKRLLKKQMDVAMDVAKQLAARTASEKERRKQPKPTVRSSKPKKNKQGGGAGVNYPQGEYFYGFEAKPQKGLTVMDRLWGLFGR